MPKSPKLRILFFFITTLFLQTIVFGQRQTAVGQNKEIEDLHQQINVCKTNDSLKVDLYNKLALSFININPDSMLFWGNKGLSLALQQNYNKGKADGYRCIGIGSYLIGENVKALAYNRKALDIYTLVKDKKGEANSYNNIAIIYHNNGKYDLSLQYYKYSLNIRKEINDVKGIGDSYNNIGNTYTDQGNYLEALKMLYSGLKIRENLRDSFGMFNSYLNISGVYFYLNNSENVYINAKKAFELSKKLNSEQATMEALIAMGGSAINKKNFSTGLDYYYQAVAIATKNNFEESGAIAFANIGETYLKIGMPDTAYECFKKSNIISQLFNDVNGMAICEIGMGKALFDQNKLSESILQLEKGYKLAKSFHSKIHLFQASEALAKAYQKQNNHEKAIQYLNTFLAYKDSMFGDETNRKIQEVTFNFQLANKQKEITSLEKDKAIQEQKQNFQKLLLTAMALLIIMLVIFLFFINKYRLKELHAKDKILSQKLEIENQAGKLEDLNAFKDKTLSIISHDLRGPIFTLSQFIEMMDEDLLTKEDYALAQINFKNQLSSIGLLLDNTLNWAKNEMANNQENIQAKTNIAMLVERNFKLFKENVSEKNIELALLGDLNLLAWANPDHIDIILRNLINNAIKFSGNGGKVSITLAQENTSVLIQIKDNGIGMSKEILTNLFSFKTKQGNYGTKGERGAGIGLILTKEFVERNNGSISVKSKEGEGTVFTLHFPIA